MDTARINMDLLEYLAAKAGCMYLSDLHIPMYQLCISRIIRNTDLDAFSLSDWNEAVQYITGEAKMFDDKFKAAEYLENYVPVEKAKVHLLFKTNN